MFGKGKDKKNCKTCSSTKQQVEAAQDCSSKTTSSVKSKK